MSNKDTVARLRAEADALEAADKAFDELPEEYRLAITLHNMLCRQNHTDGCGWEYEYLQKPHGWEGPSAPDWNAYTHGRYLQKALVMKGFCNQLKIPTGKAIELIKLMKDL